MTSAEDIIEVIGSADPSRHALFDPEWRPEGDVAGEVEPAADERARVLEALSSTPVEVDELIVQTGIAPHVMQVILLELDLSGQVEWSSGQLVALRHA